MEESEGKCYNPRMKKPRRLRPELAAMRERLRREGVTFAEIARQVGVKPNLVQSVLMGRLKGNFGQSHAVLKHLGLK